MTPEVRMAGPVSSIVVDGFTVCHIVSQLVFQLTPVVQLIN